MKCDECGRDLTEEEKINPEAVCPDCGSKIKKSFSTVKTSIKISASASSKIRDPDGFVLQEERSRSSISEKTGRPVKTLISIDRTEQEITRKTHRVKELDDYGNYKTIHEHVDEFPAKRRPKNDE